MKELSQLLPFEAKCHGCAYGLVDPSGNPIKKPWRLLSNCKDIQSINKKCPGHTHHASPAPGNSRLARLTENYPSRFVSSLAKSLLSSPSRGQRLSAQQSERTVLVADPAPSIQDPQLLIAIKTLHSNLGHPSSRALARAIKLSGGSDTAVSAALAYRCPTCERLREPKPANPAKLSDRWKNFGDLVCVDLFTLSD